MIDNLNSIYANSTYTNQTTNSISNKLNSTDFSKATDDELMEVCKDFESYFVEQMLKSMAKMSSVDGSNSDNIYASLFGVTEDSDSGMNTLSSYFGDELMSSMADKVVENQSGKGLGIAQTLYEQMKRNYSVKEV
ncbi:MAG: hypothetical protein ACI4D0_05660 [Lachnospira sp.]|nr:hypothetical protein [Clostridia bacterium]